MSVKENFGLIYSFLRKLKKKYPKANSYPPPIYKDSKCYLQKGYN